MARAFEEIYNRKFGIYAISREDAYLDMTNSPEYIKKLESISGGTIL